MLYADDTILLAESAEDLQVQLNAFGDLLDHSETLKKEKEKVFPLSNSNSYSMIVI
jgi:hypothetical protein